MAMALFHLSLQDFNRLLEKEYEVVDKEWCMGLALFGVCDGELFGDGIVGPEDTFYKIENGGKNEVSYAEALGGYLKKFNPKNNEEKLFKQSLAAVYYAKRTWACEKIMDIRYRENAAQLAVCGSQTFPPTEETAGKAWWESNVIALEDQRWENIQEANKTDTPLTDVKIGDLKAVRARFTLAVALRDALGRTVEGDLQQGEGNTELEWGRKLFQSLKFGNRPKEFSYQKEGDVYMGNKPSSPMINYYNLAQLHLGDLILDAEKDWGEATRAVEQVRTGGTVDFGNVAKLFHDITHVMEAKKASEAKSPFEAAVQEFRKLLQLAKDEKTPIEARAILLSLLTKAFQILGMARRHYHQLGVDPEVDPFLKNLRWSIPAPKCPIYKNITKDLQSCV